MYDLDFIVRRMFLIILVVLGISVTLFILQTVTIYYAARIGNNGINPDMDSYHLSVRRGYAISPILHKCFVVVAYGCQISVRELRFFLLTGCCMIIFQFLKRKYTVREKGVYVKQLERAGTIALDLEFVTQMLMGWQNDVWYVPTCLSGLCGMRLIFLR